MRLSTGGQAFNVTVERMESRTLMAYADGIVANSRLDNMAQVVSATNALGTDRVRLWNTTTFGSHTFPAATLAGLATLHNAGKHVTMVFTPWENTARPARDTATLKDVSYASVKSYFEWLTGNGPGHYAHGRDIREYVDRYEIVNEINLPKYYPSSGSLQATMNYYVGQTLRGAYQALHAIGETVVGGNVQAVAALDELVDARYTAGGKTNRYVDFCDLASVHPYETSVKYAKSFINASVKAFGKKPITATEWNLVLTDKTEPTPADLTTLRNYMSKRFESAYFYRLHGLAAQAKDQAQGLLHADYSPRRPYFNMFEGWAVPMAPKTYVLAVDDAYVEDATPTRNYGSAGELKSKSVPGAGGFTRQIYLKFDLKTIKGRVRNAQIWLFGAANIQGSVTVSARSVSSTSWSQRTLTWNTKPSYGDRNLAKTKLSSRVASWHKFDVSAYVRRQLVMHARSISFAIVGSAFGSPVGTFNSTEAASRKPTLKLNADVA